MSTRMWVGYLAIAAAVAAPAMGRTASHLALAAPSTFYGSMNVVTATLRYEGAPCATPYPELQGRVSVTIDGVPIAHRFSFYRAFGRSCTDGQWTAQSALWLDTLDIGDHRIVARYEGEPGIDPATSAPVTFRVAPDGTGMAPGGLGPLAAGLADLKPGWLPALFCSTDSTDFTFTPAPEPPRPAPSGDQRFPYGFVNYRATCNYECGFLCPATPPVRVEQDMQIVFPGPVPPGATVWAYMPSNRNPSPGWQILPASIEGNRITVRVQGGWQMVPDPDPLLRGTIALAIPAGLSSGHDWGGMWGTAGEDGWGLSIAQRDDRFFSILYVYDVTGSPAWLSLAEGAWDPTRSAFRSRVYRPLDATGAGVEVGSAWLSFTGADRGTFHYSIDGRLGEKAIQRMPASTAELSRYAGIWDEMPLGGGVTIDVAGPSLFVGWAMFRASGEPSWLVMPEGRWTAANIFEGALYGTQSSAWLASGYDVRQFKTRPVGHMRITFVDDGRGTIEYTVDGTRGTNNLVRRRF